MATKKTGAQGNNPAGPQDTQKLVEATKVVADRLAPRNMSVAGTLRELPGLASAELPGLASIERRVTLTRTEHVNPELELLWWAIFVHSDALGFQQFSTFVDELFCAPSRPPVDELPVDFEARAERLKKLPRVPGSEAYQLLRAAGEVFLLLNCGIVPAAGAGARFTLKLPPGDQSASTGGTALVDRNVDRLGRNPALTFQEAHTQLQTFMSSEANNYLETVIVNAVQGGKVPIASPFCLVGGEARLDAPCLLELIWSYWMEEGMLNQAVAAITRRFQNVRRPGRGPDPLAEMELDPLRPLSAFLWGYLQDEPNRLSVPRRAYEYNHHYGLTLYGRAVPALRAADPRSRFLEAFHNLLRQAAAFYKEDADTTVVADAFPVLNSLKELHLVLAEGAHNQFRDLPWTARAEMLVQQWLLARPETRDFLRGRYMVPYPEGWMAAVDAMKRLQGWTDTSVIHFAELARFGERILLSIRHSNWTRISDEGTARAWLRYWRPEVQSYIHAYQAATGVSLSDDVVDVQDRADLRYLQPSYHLRNRLLAARRAARRLR